jgi:acetylornithine deacetylase/succinyl-diaminopimelate desuccinylase-like protein
MLVQNLHVGEKTVANYRIEATNPGGHSSIPIPDNAIYELADALVKIRAHDFPLMLNDTTRAYFAKAGAGARRCDGQGHGGTIATAPRQRRGEGRRGAAQHRSRLPFDAAHHLRCHAAGWRPRQQRLPQRAGAINCRIFPGISIEETRQALEKVVADPRMSVKLFDDRGPLAKSPPLTPQIVGPAEKLVAKYYPGVPLVPVMSTGGTDGIYLEAVGILPMARAFTATPMAMARTG